MEIGERCFYVFFETQKNRLERCAAIGFILAGLLAIITITSPVPWVFAVSLWLILMSLGWPYYGSRFTIGIRQNDILHTKGNSHVVTPLEKVEAIEALEEELVLRMKEEKSAVRIPIKLLSQDDRVILIQTARFYWEIFQKEGPLTVPQVSDLSLKIARLEIRPVELEDFEPLKSIWNETSQFENQLHDPLPDALSQHSFSNDLTGNLYHPLRWKLGIFLSEDQDMIGFLSISLQDIPRRTADLGIGFSESYRSQGYGREAVSAIIEYLKAKTTLQRLAAGCFSHNIACRKMLEQSGMKQTGESRKFWFRNNEWVNGCEFEFVFDRTREP